MSSGERKGYRGIADKVDIISEKAFLKTYENTCATHFLSEAPIEDILYVLEEFKADCLNEMVIQLNSDKKHVILEDGKGLKLKMKILKEKEAENEDEVHLVFSKKAGSVAAQYELMD